MRIRTLFTALFLVGVSLFAPFVTAQQEVSSILSNDSSMWPSAEDSIAFSETDFQWRDLGRGAQVGTAQLVLFGRPEVISVIRYPMSQWQTTMVHAPEAKASTTDSLALRNKALFAINGSYFNMRKLTPVTFFSVRHKIVGRQDPSTIERSTGVVGVRRHLIEFLRYDSTKVDYYRRHFDFAMQCGPLLLLDGEAQPVDVISFNTVNHPRSMIGITDDGYCLMVVVDGRLKGMAEGATIWELTAIARWLGMKSALNLDGGGSSSLWTNADGTINYPCDNHKFDRDGLRTVPNVIVVK